MSSMIPLACRQWLVEGLYLVNSMNNGVRGCSPKGINHLAEYDRHDHHRHAVAQRPNHADQHQHDVSAVRVLEQPMERHLGHRHVLLAILLPFFTTLHCIGSSCGRAFFCHAAPALCQVLALLQHMAHVALLMVTFLYCRFLL